MSHNQVLTRGHELGVWEEEEEEEERGGMGGEGRREEGGKMKGAEEVYRES